jgi:hypothetical protein
VSGTVVIRGRAFRLGVWYAPARRRGGSVPRRILRFDPPEAAGPTAYGRGGGRVAWESPSGVRKSDTGEEWCRWAGEEMP